MVLHTYVVRNIVMHIHILESVQSDDATELPIKKKTQKSGMFVAMCMYFL